MRLSGVMDADQGVAVAAFVSEGQVERQRRPAVALSDDERGGRQHSWQRLRQLAPGATVVCESDRREPLPLDLPLTDERRYGDTLIRIHVLR